jgi:hypothetical protein
MNDASIARAAIEKTACDLQRQGIAPGVVVGALNNVLVRIMHGMLPEHREFKMFVLVMAEGMITGKSLTEVLRTWKDSTSKRETLQ